MPRSSHDLAALAVSLTASSIGHGQQLLWQASVAYPAPQFTPGPWYYVEDSMGDVNGDGVSDLLVYDPSAPNGSVAIAGYVAVLSGVDGSVIHASYGSATSLLLKALGVVGDVTGDGVFDYVVRADGWTSVELRSGANGSVVSTLPGPTVRDASPLGDINGDGFADFVLGFGSGPPPPVFGAGLATVYLGPTGSTVAYYVYGQYYLDAFGWDTAPLGDVNGDGVPDFIVGSPGPIGVMYGAAWSPGWAYVVSGADGTFIHVLTGPQYFTHPFFGAAVAGIGDIDLDGVPDFLVGAPGIPAFYVYSGASASLLFSASAPWGGFGYLANTLGLHVRGLRDVDGDGVPDFAVQGRWTAVSQAALVYSGATFNVLYTIDDVLPEPPTCLYGYGFDGLGDVDGDGFEEFAVPAFSWTAGAASQIVTVSLRPTGVTYFGSGCLGDLGIAPRIGVHPAAVPGAAMKLHVSETVPGRGAALAVGLSNTTFLGTSLPWYPWPVSAPLCGLLVSIDGLAATVTTPSSGMRGAASHAFTIPAMPSLTGLTFYAQWGVDNAPGFVPPLAMTRGLTITIQ